MATANLEITQVKCACADCVCVVPTDKAIVKGGRYYCSDACADGHKTAQGCEHVGCSCHG